MVYNFFHATMASQVVSIDTVWPTEPKMITIELFAVAPLQ